jgi:hypothetical protein
MGEHEQRRRGGGERRRGKEEGKGGGERRRGKEEGKGGGERRRGKEEGKGGGEAAEAAGAVALRRESFLLIPLQRKLRVYYWLLVRIDVNALCSVCSTLLELLEGP